MRTTPDSDSIDAAALIGRRCAEMGLDLAAARMVFESLYFAGVLAAARNNRSEAARLAQCDRVTVHRAIKRGAAE